MAEFTINMNHSKISGVVQIGNHNTVNQDSYSDSLTEEQWKEIRKYLSERKDAFGYDSEEYDMICEAECLSRKDDKNGFLNFLAENRTIFINSILGTAMTSAVKELIDVILH